MYLTYSKALPSFYQELVQLEMDAPDDSKVYVGFHEGFVPLAAKYYEALAPKVAEVVEEKVIEAPAKEEPIEAIVEEPIEAPVEEVEAPVVKRTRK